MSARDGELPPCGIVVCLQASSLVDHLVRLDGEAAARGLLAGGAADDPQAAALGGSHRVPRAELARLLAAAPPAASVPGGAAANTARGVAGLLSAGAARLLGARGDDAAGDAFASGMAAAGVDVSRLVRVGGAATAACVVISHGAERTMRPCFEGAARLKAADLTAADFVGAAWLYTSAYALYVPGLLTRAIELARAAGARVALDLASYELLQNPAVRGELLAVLDAGSLDVCVCNEDEAREVCASLGGDAAPPGRAAAWAGLGWLARRCRVAAVVTCGADGCLASPGAWGHGGAVAPTVFKVPALAGVEVVDTTGAGDLFSAGLISGLLQGLDLDRAAAVGCATGGAAVQRLGAELPAEDYKLALVQALTAEPVEVYS